MVVIASREDQVGEEIGIHPAVRLCLVQRRHGRKEPKMKMRGLGDGVYKSRHPHGHMSIFKFQDLPDGVRLSEIFFCHWAGDDHGIGLEEGGGGIPFYQRKREYPEEVRIDE